MLLIVLLCCALVAGCAGGQSAQPPATSGAAETPTAAESEPAPVEEQSGPAKVGDEQKSGPWTFTVTDIYTENVAPGQIPAPAGKELLFVNVGLYNSGTTTLEIKPEDFSMKDGSGATVETFAKRQAYNALDMSPLEPDYSTTTAFIYAVDPGSTGFVLTFAPEVEGTATPMEVAVR